MNKVKLFIYLFLQKYPIFLYYKNHLLNLLNVSSPLEILANQEVIILTSIVPFHKMKQRPQQIALSLSRCFPSKTIIYFEIDFGSFQQNIYPVSDNLFITNSILPFKRFLGENMVSIIATGNVRIPDLLKLFGIKYNSIVYDYYDNLDGYSNNLFNFFKKTLSLYEKVICSAKLLELQLKEMGYTNTIYLPNGVCEKDWIIDDQKKLILAKGKIKFSDKKIIGFYGGIEHWLDYDLIFKIVSRNNDKTFVFIGPDVGGYLQRNRILDLENFIHIGYVEFQELKYYSYYFDIAIIPFKINTITNAVSPVKFFEFLMQGKPVVTTGFSEILSHNNHCFIARNADDFNLKITLALEKALDSKYIENIKNYAGYFEWDNLVKKLTIKYAK